tara:strand:+ start:409 stop:618 length:210 start_codon:yes stop_codon:yes gene_type:complete
LDRDDDDDDDDDARSSRLSQNVLYKNRDANVVERVVVKYGYAVEHETQRIFARNYFFVLNRSPRATLCA